MLVEIVKYLSPLGLVKTELGLGVVCKTPIYFPGICNSSPVGFPFFGQF